MLAMDKKSKKAKLKSLVKKAPEKDIAAAELKLRSTFKKEKIVVESVLFEAPDNPDLNGDGAITKDELKTYRYETGKAYDEANAARKGVQSDKTVGQVENMQRWIIVLGSIVAAVVIAGLIALIVRGIRLSDTY